MDLTYFYPDQTYKTIKQIKNYCSGSRLYYLRKHVVNEKNGWYHVIECIGRKKYQIRDIFRHYIIPYYDYMNDNAVSRLSGYAQRYDPSINTIKLDKKYHVTTYQFKK